MLEKVRRVQTASGHDGVGGADGSGVSECHLNIVIIILLKEGIGKDAEDVTAVVIPVFGYELGGNSLNLVGKALGRRHIKALLQCGSYGVPMLLAIFP